MFLFIQKYKVNIQYLLYGSQYGTVLQRYRKTIYTRAYEPLNGLTSESGKVTRYSECFNLVHLNKFLLWLFSWRVTESDI